MVIGVCSIIKDCDENYLKEFIEWHTLIGVDYFFIYDNDSAVPIKTILTGNNIFVYDFKGDVKQLPAYMDCIAKQKNGEQVKCDWVAFIDDDEFIVPECGDIKRVLSDYDKYSGVGINWLMFGSNGIKEKTNEKQIFKFNKCLPENNVIQTHIKTIGKPELITGFQTPHNCVYSAGNCVDVNGNVINSPFTKVPIHSKIWINHYYCKSEEEFTNKIKRGRADIKGDEHLPKMKQFYDITKESIVYNTKIIELYNKLKNENSLI